MNVQEILDSVKRTFGDESGVQIQDSDIIRWVNQGVRQIVMQNEALLEKVATANASNGVQQYSLPVDLLILKGIQFKEVNSSQYFRLKGYSLSEFNEFVDGWDGATQSPGVPVMYTVFDSKIIVYPVPTVDVASGFKIYYNREPVPVTDASDTPDLPVLYHEVIIKHCILQAYELDEDWDAAGNKVSELDRDINLLRGREEWKNQETFPVITVLYEDQY